MPLPAIAASAHARRPRGHRPVMVRPAPPPIWRIGRVMLLTGFWMALWGTISPATLTSGLVLGAVFGRPRRSGVARADRQWRLSPVGLARLVVDLAVAIARDNLAVARAVVRGPSRTSEQVVTVPLRTAASERDAIVALAVTLTPGTIAVDVDRTAPGPSTIQVHSIGSSPDEVRESTHQREASVVRAARVDAR